MAESEKQEVWYQGKAFQYPHLGGAEAVQDFHGPKAAEAAYDWFHTVERMTFDSAYVYERQGDRETMIYNRAEGYDFEPGDEDQEDDDYEGDGWDDEDEFEIALGECSMMADGFCGQAGSEYCDFDCPFRDDPPEIVDLEDGNGTEESD